MDLAETMTQAPVSSAETTPGRRALLLTNITYEVEESGHRTDTPVFHVRSRDSAGQLHTFTIEGFRPYFGIDRSVLADDLGGVCNDRRVLTVSVDCDPDYWRDQLPVEIPSDADAYDVAGYLSETYPVNVEHDLTGYTTLTDEPVARVYVRTPGDVAGDNGMRDLFETTYEADVPFTRRFLISTGITRGFEADVDNDRLIYENHSAESSGAQYRQDLDSCDPPDVEARMCVFDIEVAASEGFPEPHRARDPITAITAYDSYDDSYALFGLTHSAWADQADEVADELTDELANQAGFPDQTDSDDPELADYWLVSDETELLETFHDWVLSRDPDLITGWNASGNGGFDIPYLIQRSYVVQAGQIRDYCTHSNPAVWTDEYNGEQQTGFKLSERCTLDLLEAYSKTQFRELDSETLDAVANAELGYGKTDLASDELNETWREDPVTFFSYNVRDTQATAEIEAEVELLSLYENLRRFTGAMYETASNNGPMLDTLFLRRADEEGLVLPTNEEADEDVYHGAKVFDPIPGVHPNSVYPDLSSLYPNLFAMLNLGTETIIGNEEALADSEYTADDCYQFPVDNREFAVVEKGEPIGHVDRDEYKGVKTPAGGTREMFDPQYDWLYVVKPEIRESFITSTVDELISLKNQYSGDLYSAVKRVTNSCFTPDTEVLTPDGIKNIRDVAVGDMVYSLNPDTHELETQPVTEVIEKPDYDGELVNIQNSRIDLSVTPDHRVYSKRTRHTDEWESPEAGDLNQYTQYELPHDWTRADDGERLETVSLLDYVDPESVDVLVKPTDHGRTFTKKAPCEVTRESNGRGYIISGDDYVTHRAEIRRLTDSTVRVHTGANRKWIPETYGGDDFIELCMWFVTEGSTYTSNTKEYENTTRGETTTVNLAQYDQDTGHHESISALLDRMGLTYYSDDRNHTIASRLLARVLENLCGSTSHDKALPSFIWDLTPEQKEQAFQTLLAGDGDERDGSYRYTTSSDQLRDDMIRLCFETGRNGRYSKDSGSWRIWYSPGKNNFRMNREGSTSTAENGVYCVQVANNHMLVAGRNGKFQHIPNCYGVIGDSASGGVGFRLYDRRVAEGITLAGRETITHTAERFTDYLQEHHDDEARLVAGDTDSCVTSMPNAPSLGTAKLWASEAVEHVEASYDEFVQERFGFAPNDTHRLAVELENLSSRLFFMRDELEQRQFMGSDGMLVVEEEDSAVKKRYAELVVWDDDDGWIDTDYDDTDADPLTDELDRSTLKYDSTVDYDTFETGPMAPGKFGGPHEYVSVSGFEYVRSDSAQVTRDAQKQVLTDVLLSPEPLPLIERYLKDLVADIEAGEYPLADLGRPKGISQSLDEYGFKDYEDLPGEMQTPVTEADGGAYRQTPSPTYRGAKYADDHFEWEEIGAGSKPLRVYIDTVRSGTYPAAYQYDTYPGSGYPDPPEVGRAVDAIAVDRPERLPDQFVLDTEKTIEKELQGPIEPILETLGRDWDDVLDDGHQTGLDAFC